MNQKNKASRKTEHALLPVVWIASYPKSGNTWVQAVIREAGKKYGFPQKDLDVYKHLADGSEVERVRAGVRGTGPVDEVAIFKTHSMYKTDPDMHPKLGYASVGFVYVMRHPLDMLLSYINFTRMQYTKRKNDEAYQRMLFIDLLGYDDPFTYDAWSKMTLDSIPRVNLDHALNKFTENETLIPGLKMAGCSWLEHVKSWKNVMDKMPSALLRYEELVDDERGFLNIGTVFEFTDEEITNAVKAVNDRLHDMKGKKVFYNKMTSYYCLQYFSPDAIDRFLNKFSTELEELGYRGQGSYSEFADYASKRQKS